MSFSDLIPSETTGTQIGDAFKHAIRAILVQYHPKSSSLAQSLRKHVEDTRPNNRRLGSEKTEFFPLPALNEEEASVSGTIKVVDKIFLEHLNLTEEEVSKMAHLLVGDWLSIRNLRLMKDERADEKGPYETFRWVEETSLPFHFQINAMFALCRTHLGSPSKYPDPACLEQHRGILHQSKLDVKKPEYNRAKELVLHSLFARILDCARIVLQKKEVDELKEWLPDINEFDHVTNQIYLRFATTSAAHDAFAIDDEYRAHSILFIRDALFFRVFQDAVRYADVGSMWLVYDHWIFMMRGAGCNNYGNELLEMKARFKYEYPEGLGDIIERTWLVNRWGKEGRSIPTDLYLEHNNGFTKNMFAAMGSGASIEHVQQKSSANVEVLRSLAHQVSKWFGVSDYHRRHKEVNAQADLRALMLDLKMHQVHEIKPNRIVPLPEVKHPRKKKKNIKERAIKDVLWEGRIKLTEQGLFKDWRQRTTQDGGEEDDDIGENLRDDGVEGEGFANPDGQLDHDLSLDQEFPDSPFLEIEDEP